MASPFDPREFLETDLVHGEAVESLNKWLQYGDLPKLYKRVQKALNLHPGRADLANAAKTMATFLFDTQRYQAQQQAAPRSRHATTKLAVNYPSRAPAPSAPTP